MKNLNLFLMTIGLIGTFNSLCFAGNENSGGVPSVRPKEIVRCSGNFNGQPDTSTTVEIVRDSLGGMQATAQNFGLGIHVIEEVRLNRRGSRLTFVDVQSGGRNFKLVVNSADPRNSLLAIPNKPRVAVACILGS